MSDRLSNPEFKNWVKCLVALVTTKEALHGFVEDTLTPMDVNFKKSHHGIRLFTGPNYGAAHMKYNQFSKVWEMKNYNCSSCRQIADKLLTEHTDPSSKLIGWENIKGSASPAEYWDIAKVYMSKGHWRINGPEDTDAALLLTVIKTCKMFTTSTIDIQNIINTRNELMHCTDNTVSTANMNKYFHYMLTVLEDEPSGLKSRPECQEAARKIRKLLTHDLSITVRLKQEYEMLRKALIDKEKALSREIEAGFEADEITRGALETYLTRCREDLGLSDSFEKYLLATIEELQSACSVG